MLTDDEILTAISDAQAGHTSRGSLVAIGRAVEAALLAKLRPAAPLAVIVAMERAAQRLENQAGAIAGADLRTFLSEFPAEEARLLRAALDTFARMGVGA